MFFSRSSLKVRLFVFFAIIAVLPVFLVGATLYQNAIAKMNQMMDQRIEQSIFSVNSQFEQEAERALKLVHLSSGNGELMQAYKSGNRSLLDERLAPLYKRLKEEHNVSVFEFGDEKGTVFTRGHQPGKFGDDKSGNTSIKATLAGKEIKGIEFGKSGLAVRAFLPIKDGEKVIGTLQIGFDDSFLLDVSESIGGTVAFYDRDKLVKTSDANEQKLIEQGIIEPNVFDDVKNNQTVRINDNQGFIHVYYPLKDVAGQEVIGMVRLSNDNSALTSFANNTLFLTLGIIAISLLFSLTLAYFLTRSITTPITRLMHFIGTLAKGDLTANLELEKVEHDKNEIRLLGQEAVVMSQ